MQAVIWIIAPIRHANWKSTLWPAIRSASAVPTARWCSNVSTANEHMKSSLHFEKQSAGCFLIFDDCVKTGQASLMLIDCHGIAPPTDTIMPKAACTLGFVFQSAGCFLIVRLFQLQMRQCQIILRLHFHQTAHRAHKFVGKIAFGVQILHRHLRCQAQLHAVIVKHVYQQG